MESLGTHRRKSAKCKVDMAIHIHLCMYGPAPLASHELYRGRRAKPCVPTHAVPYSYQAAKHLKIPLKCRILITVSSHQQYPIPKFLLCQMHLSVIAKSFLKRRKMKTQTSAFFLPFKRCPSWGLAWITVSGRMPSVHVEGESELLKASQEQWPMNHSIAESMNGNPIHWHFR